MPYRSESLRTTGIALALLTTTALTLPTSRVAAQEGAPTPVGSGTIKGTITSVGGLPIGGAQLRLRINASNSLTVETDESGTFTLGKVPAGDVWVVARRIGFRPDSVRLSLANEQVLPATLALERIAVELDAVRVIGRRDLRGHLAGFYRRMNIGNGRFFTADDLDRRNAMNMTDVFRMVPGIRVEGRNSFQNVVRMRGSRCAPLVWLDNQPLSAAEVDLDAFDPRSFDGIEVYSGPASVPVEFQGNMRMSSACGTIILWSKRGELRTKKAKKGEPTPTERIALMLQEGEAYIPTDVDQAALPDSTALVRPVYPDSLFEELVGGRVVAEFVVDRKGEPVMETFSAVTTTHRLFVEPVRRAVREQRFAPAVRRGKVVQQVLQLPFEFVPDSTARRRR
jgi:hypothetical protein